MQYTAADPVGPWGARIMHSLGLASEDLRRDGLKVVLVDLAPASLLSVRERRSTQSLKHGLQRLCKETSEGDIYQQQWQGSRDALDKLASTSPPRGQ